MRADIHIMHEEDLEVTVRRMSPVAADGEYRILTIRRRLLPHVSNEVVVFCTPEVLAAIGAVIMQQADGHLITERA